MIGFHDLSPSSGVRTIFDFPAADRTPYCGRSRPEMGQPDAKSFGKRATVRNEQWWNTCPEPESPKKVRERADKVDVQRANDSISSIDINMMMMVPWRYQE